MGNSKMDEYLQNGIYGAKQTKPDERRKFLGTLRERIVVALTKSQVMEGFLPELEKSIKENPGAALLLNGEMDYSFLSRYIQLARKLDVPFSIVTNKDSHTDIGLVLAFDHAINKEEIYLKKKEEEQPAEDKKKAGLLSELKHFFTK